MVERFGSAHTACPSIILQTADDFDRAATEAVLDPQTRPAQEFITARASFLQLVQSGRLLYYEDGANEYGDLESDSDEDAEKSQGEATLSVSHSIQAAESSLILMLSIRLRQLNDLDKSQE